MHRFYKNGIKSDLLYMNQLRFASNIVKNGRMINKTHVEYLNAGMMCKLYVTFIFGGWGYLYTANFQWHSK